MALKNWHYGKLIILWIWGIVLISFVSEPLRSGGISVLRFIIIVFIFVIPLILSIVTWIWLSAKEKMKN
jgi:hypothetical protein